MKINLAADVAVEKNSIKTGKNAGLPVTRVRVYLVDKVTFTVATGVVPGRLTPEQALAAMNRDPSKFTFTQTGKVIFESLRRAA